MIMRAIAAIRCDVVTFVVRIDENKTTIASHWCGVDGTEKIRLIFISQMETDNCDFIQIDLPIVKI